MNCSRQLLSLLLFFVAETIYALSFEVDGIKYEITNSANPSTLEVGVAPIFDGNPEYGSHYTGKIVIPDSVKWFERTFAVTSIMSNAFYKSTISQIVLPSSIRTIDINAFNSCPLLTHVTFSEGVESINAKAFFRCKQIESVDIPNSVLQLGEEAFSECSNLQYLVIGNGIAQIPNRAFYGCDLRKVVLSDSLKSIGEWAFYANFNLTSVHLPETLESIGFWAFGYCDIKFLAIPDKVNKIDDGAFYGNDNLETVIYGNGTSFFSGTFFATSQGAHQNLKNIVLRSEEPIDFWMQDILEYAKIFGRLFIPQGTLESYKQKDGWNGFFNIIQHDFVKLHIRVDAGAIVTIGDWQANILRDDVYYIPKGNKVELAIMMHDDRFVIHNIILNGSDISKQYGNQGLIINEIKGESWLSISVLNKQDTAIESVPYSSKEEPTNTKIRIYSISGTPISDNTMRKGNFYIVNDGHSWRKILAK